MVPARITLIGATLFAVGMMAIGLALSTNLGKITPAYAGEECATVDPDPSPTSDPTITGSVNSLGIECTSTPRPPRVTRTPTATATSDATSTPEPQPTSPPAPTATQPGGGVGSGGVEPPNTGTGPSERSTLGMWLIALGAVATLAGGGLVAGGVVRRR